MLKKGQKNIVKGVDLSLQRGHVLALVGESGSGKTMTCKSVLGLCDKTRFEVGGTIWYKDKNLAAMPEKQLRNVRGNHISMIVQNPMTAFDPTWKIGAQMVETVRAHQKIKKSKAREMALQGLLQLNMERPEQILNSYPHTLSGGMLQRVAIALSMILKPDIILSDESTTALDVYNQNLVLEHLRAMKLQGAGILLVTHDFGITLKLADEVCVMKQGEIVERGSVFSVISAPVHPYTKELVAASLLTKEDQQNDTNDKPYKTIHCTGQEGQKTDCHCSEFSCNVS